MTSFTTHNSFDLRHRSVPASGGMRACQSTLGRNPSVQVLFGLRGRPGGHAGRNPGTGHLQLAVRLREVDLELSSWNSRRIVKDRRLYPRGKTLGGFVRKSNLMVCICGDRADFRRVERNAVALVGITTACCPTFIKGGEQQACRFSSLAMPTRVPAPGSPAAQVCSHSDQTVNHHIAI